MYLWVHEYRGLALLWVEIFGIYLGREERLRIGGMGGDGARYWNAFWVLWVSLKK